MLFRVLVPVVSSFDWHRLKQDSTAYMQSANRDTVLLCQIESQLGVSNIDAIMAVDGIDGAMIGPNDMSQDFGILGQ